MSAKEKTVSRASADGTAGNDKTGGLNESLTHIITQNWW